MTKTILSQFILLLIGMCLVSQSVQAQNIEGREKLDEVALKAKETLNLFLSGNSEAIYARFDPVLKGEVTFSDFKGLNLQIGKVLGKIDKIELMNSRYSDSEGGIYSYIYDIETQGNKIAYSIHLKKPDTKFIIRGFNFKVDSSELAKKGLSPLHIVVAVLFGACLIIQVLCLIYFAKIKDLKRKWLYIIASFVGFPAGVGINWATGAFMVRFGFNLPAVSISWPLNEPGVFLISAYFPIGLLLWLKEKSKKDDFHKPIESLLKREG